MSSFAEELFGAVKLKTISLLYISRTDISDIIEWIFYRGKNFERDNKDSELLPTLHFTVDNQKFSLCYWNGNKYYAWMNQGRLLKNGEEVFAWKSSMPKRYAMWQMCKILEIADTGGSFVWEDGKEILSSGGRRTVQLNH